MTDAAGLSDALRQSNRLLIEALRALAEAGEGERACRIAGAAWSATRRAAPDEAERLNQALHYLTRLPTLTKESSRCPIRANSMCGNCRQGSGTR
jgi:hypothetical protein